MKIPMNRPGAEAADKRQEAEDLRRKARSYRRQNDAYHEQIFEMEANKLEREAEQLDTPSQSLVVGSGGEIINPPGKGIILRDTLIDEELDNTAVDASRQRLQLLRKLDIIAPALDAANSIIAENSLEKMLAHQIAACHHLGMGLCAEAQECRDPAIQAKKLSLGIRFMDTFQRGLETLTRLRTGGQQHIVVKHQQVNVSEGAQAVVTDVLTREGGGDGKKK